MKKNTISIARREIGLGCPVYIIAEVSANHGQNFNRAAAMIRKASACGADAVKFQTYTPDSLTIDSDRKCFRIKHPQWGGQTLYKLYQKACTPLGWFAKLKKIADDVGIAFISTAFDKPAVDLLESIGVPAHKIASFELVDHGLIEYAAKTKKPLIISTGMASSKEIKEALNVAKKAGAKDITLLKCVSSYPAKPDQMNLRTIPDMARRFGVPVGLSDHSMTDETAIAAVAMGAVMVEKHFTLSRKIETPDGFFSMEPAELKRLIERIRLTERVMGKVSHGPVESEKAGLAFRRSLFAVKNISKGEPFTDDNVRSIRPSDGLEPKHLKKILQSKAARRISRGTPLNWEMIG